MSSDNSTEIRSTISPEMRDRLHRLTESLLAYYGVTAPPVPVDLMLREPAGSLWQVETDQISSIIGHGLYRYAPRLAGARLLYRVISDSASARQAGFDAPWPASRREIKYFARCLLMPADWIHALSEPERAPEAISERFQVTPFDAVVRLAELGLPVPDGTKIDFDE